MIDRVADRLPITGGVRVNSKNKEPILNTIVREFGARHSMNLKIDNTLLVHVGEGSSGTGIHLDGLDGGSGSLRLWIPLTFSKIDNLCLGVGYAPASGYRLLEEKVHVGFVDLYQQISMTAADWIFFENQIVHHFSGNVRSEHSTQERWAMVVNLQDERAEITLDWTLHS